MSAYTAGWSQPGARQVRSRIRTHSSNAVDGRYRSSGSALGYCTNRTWAPALSSSASSVAGRIAPPTITAADGRGGADGGSAGADPLEGARNSAATSGRSSPWQPGSVGASNDSAGASTWITTLDARPSSAAAGQAGAPHAH